MIAYSNRVAPAAEQHIPQGWIDSLCRFPTLPVFTLYVLTLVLLLHLSSIYIATAAAAAGNPPWFWTTKRIVVVVVAVPLCRTHRFSHVCPGWRLGDRHHPTHFGGHELSRQVWSENYVANCCIDISVVGASTTTEGHQQWPFDFTSLLDAFHLLYKKTNRGNIGRKVVESHRRKSQIVGKLEDIFNLSSCRILLIDIDIVLCYLNLNCDGYRCECNRY
jgi:hypothetical protein